jgi:hypothetical protein
MSAGTGAGPAVSQQEERRRGCGARGLFGLGRSLGRLGELWRGKKRENQGVGVWASAGCVQAESRWLSFFFFFHFPNPFSKRVLSKTNKDITETANHKKNTMLQHECTTCF